MPSLKICCRPTFVAGDDLRTPTVIAVLLRIVQVIVIIPVFQYASTTRANYSEIVEERCRDSFSTPNLVEHSWLIMGIYVYLSFILAIGGIILELFIFCTSIQGTPTEPQVRRRLIPLCNIKMIPMSFLRVSNLTLGGLTLTILRQYCGCGSGTYTENCPNYYDWHHWYKVLVATQVIEVVFMGMLGIYFGCKFRPNGRVLSARARWNVCCRCCCTATSLLTCCLAGGNEASTGDMSEVSLVLADIFDDGGAVDVVLSDTVVGLRMLARVQKQRHLECREEVRKRASVCLVQNKDLETGLQGRRSTRDPIFQLDEILEEGFDHSTRAEDHERDGEGDENMKAETSLELAELALRDDSENEDDSKEGHRHDKGGEDRNTPEMSLELAELALHDASENQGFSKTTKRRRNVVYQMYRHHGMVEFRPTTRDVLSRKQPRDKYTIAEGARFLRFAVGIYTFRNEPRFCRLLGREAKHYYHAQMAQLDLDQAELVYVQDLQGVVRTPYCIAVDHAWKSVVVAIRGTLSLDDVVADLTMLPRSMEEWGRQCGFDGSDFYVHSGMLRSTEWIYDDLESQGILAKLLSETERPDLAGYRLRLTGHSLGAGIASILSFMLKAKFPTLHLRCSCFCPPGCTMSEHMAESCKDYLTSYVLDTDMVPRMSIEAVTNMRADVLEMISRIKVTKHEATRAKPGEEELQRILHRQESIPPSKFREQIDLFRAYQEEKKRARAELQVPLYPPGNIVHLFKVTEEEPAGCFGCTSAESRQKQHDYAARWAERSDLAEILISSHFMADHSSPTVLAALERAAEFFGLSAPFTVDGPVE